MRKIFLALMGLATFSVASAQFSAGANLNYTKYGGDVSRGTPGIGVRAGYEKERFAFYLGFTNGFAITEEGSTIVSHKTTGETKTVPTEAKLSFKTISLMSHRTLIGDEESAGSFYLGFGASFVMANIKEDIKGTLDNNYQAPESYRENETGFTINALAGGEYRLGKPAVFAEAGFAFPANQVGNTLVYNAIPSHLAFNVGVRFRLGGE